MEENTNQSNDIIDLKEVFSTLWSKRKVYYRVLPIVFVLSCLWILPQPRYYDCEVALAPEGGEESVGGLASVASSFGLNIGEGGTSDAIYPMLYPELFESTEFICGLFNIQVETEDGTLKTDYYTYLKKHQQKNWLTKPFNDFKSSIIKMISPDPVTHGVKEGEINPFKLSKNDYDLVDKIKENIICNVDKKTDVITIKVRDQDRQICALMADSIRDRLQEFIIDYRTKKVRQDVKYYQHLTDSAKVEYEKALIAYGAYNDGHRNVTLQTYVELGDKLKNDMQTKLTTYNTFAAQLAAAKAKVQERTPSFTTLKSATVPQKPAGPKRMMFVLGMLFVSTFVSMMWQVRKILFRFE